MSQPIRSPENFLSSYQLMVDSVTDFALIMLDPFGYVVTWNKGAENINGFSRTEIIGHHFSRFYPPDEVKAGRPDRILAAALKNGKYEEEGWRVRKDGSLFFASIVITALHDEAGRLTGFAKVTRDISERLRYEAGLEEANERLEARVQERTAQLFEEKERAQVMLKSIGDAVITTDKYGRVNFLNPIAEALTGWTTLEAAGRSIPDILQMVNEATRLPAPNPIEEAICDNRIVALAKDTVLIARNGREIFIEDSAAPVHGQNGELIGAIMVIHDVSCRKKAEKALMASEEKFRTTFEHAPVGMCHIALDGKVLMANPAIAQMFGYSLDEIYHLTPADVVHPEDIPVDVEGAKILINGKIKVFKREKRHIRKDKTICWTNVSSSLIRNELGEPAYFISTVEDITERKKAEQTLAETNQQVSNILESITDGFFAVDKDWRVTYINHQAQAILNISAPELLGQNLWTVFPDAVGSKFYQEYHDSMAIGDVVSFVEFFPPLKTWFEVRAYPHATGLSVYFQNINGQIQAEEKLRQQAELLNLSHDAIMVRDLDDTIVYWNHGAEKLYGINADRAIGQKPHELLGTQLSESLNEIHANLQVFGEWSGELKHVLKDGRELHVLSNWVLERDSNGVPVRVLQTNRDITDRKRFELALRESEERNRSIIEQAAVGIAHTDLGGHLQQVNPKFCKTLGYSRHELLQRHYQDITYWEDRSLSLQVAQQLLERNQSERSFEKRYVRKDGQLVWCRVTLSLARDEIDGQPKNFIAIAEDISEQRQAQEALRQALQESQKILDYSLDLIVVIDRYGHFKRVSAASEQILGYKPEELLGKPYIRFVHPADIGKTNQTAQELISVKVIPHFENRFIHKNGTVVNLTWTTTWSAEDRSMIAIGRAVTQS